MRVKKWVGCVLVVTCAMVAARAAAKEEPVEGGKGSAFKSKTYEVKENGEVTVVLSFEAGKEVTVTTKADKDTDVNLFVKGKYFEAKGTYELVALGAGRTRRVVRGDVEVRVTPLVRKVAERMIVGEVRKTFDVEAVTLRDLCLMDATAGQRRPEV